MEEIKTEIQDALQARPRAKRLPCPSDGNDDEIEATYRDRYQQIERRHREHFHLATTSLPLVLLLLAVSHCLLG